MSTTADSAYTSAGETSPKDESFKSARPQSLLAVNFADQLNNIFLLNDTLDELANSVENKRFSLTSHNAELEALQARLKRTEELLEQKKKRLSLPASPTGVPPMPNSPPPPPPAGSSTSGAAAPPMPNGSPPPPPKDESAAAAGEGKEGFVVVERSPSVVNGGSVPPMPTRMAPPLPYA